LSLITSLADRKDFKGCRWRRIAVRPQSFCLPADPFRMIGTEHCGRFSSGCI
jgi:hypothetical protein